MIIVEYNDEVDVYMVRIRPKLSEYSTFVTILIVMLRYC